LESLRAKTKNLPFNTDFDFFSSYYTRALNSSSDAFESGSFGKNLNFLNPSF
jgi:hypothetical protein